MNWNSFVCEHLTVDIYSDRQTAGVAGAAIAAAQIREVLAREAEAAIVLASAVSQDSFLAALRNRGDIEWSRLTVLLTITSFSRWNESRQAAFGMNMLTVALEAAVTAVRMGHPFLETL